MAWLPGSSENRACAQALFSYSYHAGTDITARQQIYKGGRRIFQSFIFVDQWVKFSTEYPAFDLISGGLKSVGKFTNQKSLHTDTITNQMTLEQNREIDDRGLLRHKPQVGSYGWLDDLCSVKDQD